MSGNVVYDGGGGGNIGGGSGGSYGDAGRGGTVDSDKFEYLSPSDITNNSIQDRISNIPNTAKPTTVSLPNEIYIGNASDIINIYGTDLSNIENPFPAYLTGYTESTKTGITADGISFTYTLYTPTYEYSDAYNEFNTALQDAKDEIRKNDNKSKGEKEKRDNDNWDIEFNFIYISSDPYIRLQNNYNLIPSAQLVQSSIDGSIYDWFAGGTKYDAPRAGNALFNETGDLNTVVFLGLQDKNYNKQLKNRLINQAEVYRMLEVTAGTSVNNDSIFTRLAQVQRATAPSGAITISEYERGKGGLFATPNYTKSVDTDALTLAKIREGENNNFGDFFLDVVDIVGDDQFTTSVKDVADNSGSSISDGWKGVGDFIGF